MGRQTSTSHPIRMIRVLFLVFFLSLSVASRRCTSDTNCDPIPLPLWNRKKQFQLKKNLCVRRPGEKVGECAECWYDDYCRTKLMKREGVYCDAGGKNSDYKCKDQDLKVPRPVRPKSE